VPLLVNELYMCSVTFSDTTLQKVILPLALRQFVGTAQIWKLAYWNIIQKVSSSIQTAVINIKIKRK